MPSKEYDVDVFTLGLVAILVMILSVLAVHWLLNHECYVW